MHVSDLLDIHGNMLIVMQIVVHYDTGETTENPLRVMINFRCDYPKQPAPMVCMAALSQAGVI